MAKPARSARALAAMAISPVLQGKASLSQTLSVAQQSCRTEDQAFLLELVHGSLRLAIYYQAVMAPLLQRKISDARVEALLLIGAHQLLSLRTPDHAALAETVQAARELNLPKLTGFINAILRNLLRQQTTLVAQAQHAAHAHPSWLKTAIERDWPKQAQDIIQANNVSAPITLRVNAAASTREAQLEQLRALTIDAEACAYAPMGIRLANSSDLRNLVGLKSGELSVQDEAAQLAAQLLAPQAGERVLDACAAPGGKTAHLLELQPALAELVAIDSDAQRLQRVDDTVRRVRQAIPNSFASVTLHCAEAQAVNHWWDGRLFDAILLDAPCTATGVIRRHPDIKLLRRARDVETTVTLQAELLQSLWPLLKPGGRLLYATCSVLKVENASQIQAFCAQHTDAECLNIADAYAGIGLPSSVGLQILPSPEGPDGFFFSLLRKRT